MAMERKTMGNGAVIESHKFTLSEVGENHNKFWNVKLHDSDDVWAEWGRVGVTNDFGTHRVAGRRMMDTLIRSKEKKGYRENDVIDGNFDTSDSSSGVSVSSANLKQIAQDQIAHSTPETKKLITWFAKVNRHNITGATDGRITFNAAKGLFQTEQGIVTPDTIKSARDLLVKIGDSIAKGDFKSKKVQRNVGDYLMYIPQSVGMKLKIEKLLPDLQAVQQQGQILDALDASYISATSVHTTDKTKKKDAKKPKVFETKLTLVTDQAIIKRIDKFYMDSRNQVHYNVYDLKLKKVWAVEISVMEDAFDRVGRGVGNVMELFHGSQPSNCLSILKAGLVIPPASSAHVTARMFSDGVYASDQSTKALNYSTNFWGQQDVGRYFMFLLDMAMGKSYTPHGPDCNLPKPGYDSTLAVGSSDRSKIKKYGRSSGVMNNEMIVYKTSQVNIKYLMEFGK